MRSLRNCSIKTSLAAMVLVAATVACDQSMPTQPTSDAAAPAPMLNFTNNPDNGNGRIFRTETGGVGFGILDPNSPLLAVLSTVVFCDIGVPHTVSIQEVYETPDNPLVGQVRLLIQAKDINMWIVDTSQPGDCFGGELVASGTGSVIQTENGRNTIGATGHGKLTGIGGERLNYSATLRIVWDTDDFSTKSFTMKFNLH